MIPPELLVDEEPLSDVDLQRFYDTTADDPADPFAPSIDPGPAAQWTVDGPGTAAWAMAKLAAAHALIVDAATRRDAYVARVVAAYEAETRRAARDAEFFSGHLTAYAIGERIRTGDATKTIHTPAGTIKTTRHAPKVVVTDEGTVLVWAESHAPEAIKRTLLSTPVTKAVGIIEVPTTVVVTCGCVVDTNRTFGDHPATWTREWAIGTAIACPSCGNDALIGQWRTTVLVPVDADGNHVPGVDIEPEHVTAKAVTA